MSPQWNNIFFVAFSWLKRASSGQLKNKKVMKTSLIHFYYATKIYEIKKIKTYRLLKLGNESI